MPRENNLYPNVMALHELREYAALTAAFVASTEIEIQMAEGFSLYFTYERGAAGGAFDFQIQVSPYADGVTLPSGAEEWASMVLYTPDTLVAGSDANGAVQQEYITYEATGDSPEAFVYPVELLGVAERLRVLVRESGVVGTPGDLQIEALAR